MLTATDQKFLRRAVDLAREALEAGDAPFGSLLVSGEGKVLKEARNLVGGGDHTQHPEFNLARWAAANLTPEERSQATVYTSGEHCPMCSAAHAWVGLGRIVYASSASQLADWQEEMGLPLGPVRNLPIEKVIRNAVVEGPAEEFAEEIRELQRRYRRNPEADKR